VTVDRGAAISALIALVGLASAVVLNVPARAQGGERGDGHAANHDWYRTGTPVVR
jgi:hypothetical protein